jgi:hypothetical protein
LFTIPSKAKWSLMIQVIELDKFHILEYHSRFLSFFI